MNKKTKPIKPTGEIGPVIISKDKTGFQPVEFPKNKEDIEKFIVNGFLKSAQQQKVLHFETISYKQNELDDFDYSLETSIGSRYLELMEIAPLEHLQGKYGNAPSSYKLYEFAEFIYNKIMYKSIKYSSMVETKIILLLYITHWNFNFDTTVIALLQYWTVVNRNNFDLIYLYVPCNSDFGRPHLIFPTPLDYWKERNFSPVRYRDSIIHLSPPPD
jgi:hypothetical protein